MAMRSKTLISWPKKVTTSLVEQLIKAERNVEKAVIVFDSATAEYANGFQHDHKTYGLIISKLLSANQFIRAEEFVDRMRKEECKVTEEIYLSICRAYGRVHKPHDVMRVFQKMKESECEPSLKANVTVFSILVDENQLKVALKFYKYMRQLGFPPNVPSLNVLIKALSKNNGTMDSAIRIFREMPKHGCNPDTYTYGTLINGLCKFGKISEAKNLFKEMEIKGCLPSVITYTSLIHGLCQLNDLDEAMNLLQEMEGKSVYPNVYTYSSLINGLCIHGRSFEAMELLEVMVKKGHKPNMVTYSTLLHGLCKEKKLLDALKIFDRMKLQGLNPDAGLYWKIIELYCDGQKFQEAANFLDEMVLEGVPIKRLTWSLHVKIHNIVVRGLCSVNDSNRAFQLYCSMRNKGICVDVETFESLIGVLCKKRDIYKAIRVFDEMVIDGCIPGEDVWGDLVCRVLGQQKAQKASDLMNELVFGNQT
ncbi:pentatricopeptide repeat-containing protein At5g46100 [Rutidosis leptorrhynchoides]|uniref:pentatricopeptide repeat-containing protein At5g46100 n=1 Tax=Rutidosis leptorrhynchoides TaxID=125765 RepID=UPI003A98FBA9